jgi:NAD+ kinase
MKLAFKTIVIMGRQQTEGMAETLSNLITYLQKRDINIIIEKDTAVLLPTFDLPTINRQQLAGNCDLIIVVGGDGSLLSASHFATDQNIPIVGINRGRLGFLTDIRPDEIKTLDKILQGEYLEEARFLLNAEVQHQDHTLTQEIALNEVVLLPSVINRMIEFTIYIDKQLVCTQRADGLIVATPTGSTAHALSGGGPILHPGLDAIVLLPMFPHTLSSRPIVVKGQSNIEIVIAEDCKTSPNISCDGQELIPIPSGGKISIKKHANKLRLIHLKDYNYYETLRSKLHWESK